MNDEQRREELATFLRTRRARLSAAALGLSVGSRRRTPGLRREEVAQLAGISTPWYTQLEQGRNIRVSTAVLENLARVLRLSPSERAHLFLLAHHQSPPMPPYQEAVSPALQMLLDSLTACPAYLVGRRFDLLAWNRAAEVVFGDFRAVPERERNLLWLLFAEPTARQWLEDWESHARYLLQQFRASYVHHVGDPWFLLLIEDLKTRSPEFEQWWTQHELPETGQWPNTFNHPVVGRLLLEHLTLTVVGTQELQVIVQTPQAGSDTIEKVRHLLERAGTAVHGGPPSGAS
jgi:transcriptional regulator with XRE-family HTH domain